MSTNVNGNREVDLVLVLFIQLRNDYVRGNHFSEIVHDHSCENLLDDGLLFLCVKTRQPDGVFQCPERGFNAPSHVINGPELIGWEISGRKIRNDGFMSTTRQDETNNPKGNRVIQVFMQIQKIKC
ncbi:hypothetical protein D3C73_1108630 [compost metagenome]